MNNEKFKNLMQRIFTKSAKHLLKQNAKAMNDKSCLYHSKDGKKCAVGCLINDEFYRADWEGRPAGAIPNIHKNIMESFGIKDVSITSRQKESLDYLLRSLQRLHDFYDAGFWEGKLIDLAEELNLRMPK